MEPDEVSWLRANKHRIVVGTSDEGLAMFTFDDREVEDTLHDYLEEVLEGSLGDTWIIDSEDHASGVWTRQRIFRDPQVTPAQLQGVLDRI